LLFEEIKHFFESEVSKGTYENVTITEPLVISDASGIPVVTWYPTKWYRCKICGMVWAFDYPDFPAKGCVYKLTSKGDPVTNSIFWKRFR